jgi:hypothetical protein
MFFFVAQGESLRDNTAAPLLLPSFAFSMLLAERPSSAVDVLDIALGRAPGARELRYWRAWARWAVGDSSGAAADLEACGVRATRELSPVIEAVAARTGADTVEWIGRLVAVRDRAGLSPWIHARLAALCLASPARQQRGIIEAYAYRVLAPGEPNAWRKWASAQLAVSQYESGLRSLEHYLSLAGERGWHDDEAEGVARTLRNIVHGEYAQRAVR